jgi:glycosyltransferase involved in cell wall biosynthesis
MNQNYPFISALIVTYNESKYIERVLKSLIYQDYPFNLFEIIIVDGCSTDETVFIAKSLINKVFLNGGRIPKVTFLNNPKKILAAGWNIGIKNALGEYVIRIDAHAEAAANLLRLSVETILDVNTVCVGGKIITKATSERGKIITDILSSSFGVGNSSFRVSTKAGYADTAVYGLYRRDIFEIVGYFDESLIRNQDIELHSRIRKHGGKFYFNPDIITTYYSRDSIKKLLNQAFQNGYWNIIIYRVKKSKLSFRYFVPLFFFLFLLFSTFGGLLLYPIRVFEYGIIVLYFTLALIASLIKTNKISQVLVMPFLFFIFHMAYGIGSLYGFVSNITGANENTN